MVYIIDSTQGLNLIPQKVRGYYYDDGSSVLLHRILSKTDGLCSILFKDRALYTGVFFSPFWDALMKGVEKFYQESSNS